MGNPGYTEEPKSLEELNPDVEDAEATIKFAIFDAITGNWHKKSDENFAKILRDEVFKRLFEPQFRWAIKEYLKSDEQ